MSDQSQQNIPPQASTIAKLLNNIFGLQPETVPGQFKAQPNGTVQFIIINNAWSEHVGKWLQQLLKDQLTDEIKESDSREPFTFIIAAQNFEKIIQLITEKKLILVQTYLKMVFDQIDIGLHLMFDTEEGKKLHWQSQQELLAAVKRAQVSITSIVAKQTLEIKQLEQIITAENPANADDQLDRIPVVQPRNQ